MLGKTLAFVKRLCKKIRRCSAKEQLMS